MIRFRQFEKSYEGRLIIAAPDLTLHHSLYWLKGGNGSGKTTLLKSVAGLIPFKGAISIRDKDIRRHRVAWRRAVNYAAAEPLFPQFLTGHDLISLYEETKGGTAAQTADLTTRFGVQGYMRDKIGTYSSGMTKKLSLVLAFIGRPELILLDEPLITLDTAAVAALRELMDDRFRSGVTLLITSHQDVPPVHQLTPELLFFHDKVLTVQP